MLYYANTRKKKSIHYCCYHQAWECMFITKNAWNMNFVQRKYYKLPEHSHSYAIKSILRRSFQQTTSAVLLASFAWFSHSAAVWSVRKTSAVTNNHTSYYVPVKEDNNLSFFFSSFFFSSFFLPILLVTLVQESSYFQPLLYEYNWFTLWKQSPTCDARIVH